MCATAGGPPFRWESVSCTLLCIAALSPWGAAGGFVPRNGLRLVIEGGLSPFSEGFTLASLLLSFGSLTLKNDMQRERALPSTGFVLLSGSTAEPTTGRLWPPGLSPHPQHAALCARRGGHTFSKWFVFRFGKCWAWERAHGPPSKTSPPSFLRSKRICEWPWQADRLITFQMPDALLGHPQRRASHSPSLAS